VLSLATIQRLDARVGFIASWFGGGPPLARTQDDGASWQRIAVPDVQVTALRFIDVNVGWIAGLIPRPVQGIACQQAAPSGVAPCYGAVLRTQDGGLTWQRSLLIPYYGTYSYPVQQIEAIDGQTAWALILDCAANAAPHGVLGCPREVRRTTDGGRTWITQTTGYIGAIRFASPSRGWLATAVDDGTFDVQVTNDGGLTWTTHLHTTSGTVVGLDAANSLSAWVITQDGGYCSATTCANYELLRTVDGGVTWTSLGNPKATAVNCWGGHLVGPVFASPTTGWLAENTGAGGARAVTGLLRTDDAGRNWTCTTEPTNTYLTSAADPRHVWVLTHRLSDDGSAVFTSEDGGISWRELNLGGVG
ncbi:MAG TPA: hypothetical protein VEU76_03755, partial [Candidatus Udaeobacter sp.]|nr:hypothetical protein [Candidatus Udaeobacter sp.]